MNNALGQVVTVITAIVGVAILATLVSRNAQTPAVIKSATDGISSMIRAATGPVSGAPTGYQV
jgi:hypothetical protein